MLLLALHQTSKMSLNFDSCDPEALGTFLGTHISLIVRGNERKFWFLG